MQPDLIDINDIVPPVKETKYRNWAFRFLIYLVLINILVAYMVINTTTLNIELEGYEDTSNTSYLMLSLIMVLSNILLLVGTILTVLSVIKKEKQDYKYILSILGYSFFLIVAIISFV